MLPSFSLPDTYTHRAAFNGLFVLGMLIKIKNHLGNKSSLYSIYSTWHGKECMYTLQTYEALQH